MQTAPPFKGNKMALSKNVILDNGVTVSYFRVDGFSFQTGRVLATVGAYTNQAAATSGKRPVHSQHVELNSNQFTKALLDSGDILATVYQGIKNFALLPEVQGISLNKGLLSGEFEDV